MPTNYTEKNYQPLPNKEAIIHFNGKTLLTAESYLDVKAYEHALAFTVAGIMDEDLLKDVRDAVASALENGEDFRTFKQRLKPYLMSKGWLSEVLDDGTKQLVAGSNRRLKTIFSTNLQSAYSAGQWSRIQQTKAFLPYLQYMKSVSEHPRLDHKKYYGLTRKADDVIWTYIMPQNDYGCKCWVRQLTRRQAEKILEQQKQDIANGKAKPFEMEWDDYTNPKTGETTQIPTGINPSFAHNHDRLTALLRLAEDKHGTDFSQTLRKQVDDFTLELIFQPNFTRGIETVMSTAFANRFAELESIVKEADGNRDNSMAIRKAHAKGDNYAVATISPSIQQALDSQTAIVWLSDDTIIKMLAHHPELDLLPLFKDTAFIIKNAKLIVQESDTHVSYFQIGDTYYKATIKATQDKKELYLLTVFSTNEKEIKRVLKKSDNIIVNNIE